MAIIAVLPAYNEAADLPALLERYKQLAPRLNEPLRMIVVDDCSTDETASVAETFEGLELELVRHPRNQGLGGALWSGLTRAARRAQPDDIVITMDADNTHDPSYIPSIINAIREGGLDVVVASRYAPGGREMGVSWMRKRMSHAAAWFYRHAYGLPNLNDYSCGYRGFRASLLHGAFDAFGHALIRESGFQATGEVILNLRHFTKQFGEVPFDLHYELKTGSSKMRVVRVAVHTLACLWRLRKRPVPTSEELSAWRELSVD